MVALVASIVLVMGSVTPPQPPRNVFGGTDEQTRQVRDAVAKVPECIRKCTGAEIPVVVIRVPGINATYSPVGFQAAVTAGTANGGYPATTNSGRPWPPAALNGPAITIWREQIPHWRQDIALDRDLKLEDMGAACGHTDQWRAWAGNLDSAVLHEYAHHYQLGGCKTGKKIKDPVTGVERDETNAERIDRFLAIDYTSARAAVLADTTLSTLNAQLNTAMGATPVNRETVCDLQRKIAKRHVELGIPERFVGDTHAMDSREYFAVAIETMVHFPDMFCAGYSAAERQWLADNMGDCIKATRSSCPKDPTRYLDPKPATGADWFKR